jgi:hypothetical protein
VDDRAAENEVADVLALELGRIVMWAVWTDEVCADLAVEYQRAAGTVDRSKVMGESGNRLAVALRQAGADAWADEYLALYSRRNDVVHGLWSADANHRNVVRPVRGGAHAGAFTVSSWDASWLDQLARDLERFFGRARAQLFALAGIADQPDQGGPAV